MWSDISHSSDGLLEPSPSSLYSCLLSWTNLSKSQQLRHSCVICSKSSIFHFLRYENLSFFLFSCVVGLQVPSKLLVQVPRYGKQFQIYKRIVPGIKLDPTPLMCNQGKIMFITSHLLTSHTLAKDTCFICGETAPNNCSECMGDFNAKDTVHFCDECNARVHKNPKRVAHKPDREDLPELELLSVLCIETSHYVCFSRDNNGRWLFFDSMADRLCESPPD